MVHSSHPLRDFVQWVFRFRPVDPTPAHNKIDEVINLQDVRQRAAKDLSQALRGLQQSLGTEMDGSCTDPGDTEE